VLYCSIERRKAKDIYGGGRPAFRPLQWLESTAPRFLCLVVLVILDHRGLHLCTEWLCKVFPQAVFRLAFHLRKKTTNVNDTLVGDA